MSDGGWSVPSSGDDSDWSVSATPHPQADLSVVAAAVETTGAAGFVHVGDRFDDSMRYLTGFDGPDRGYALVVTAERAVLCAPSLFTEQATREFVTRPTQDEQPSRTGSAPVREVSGANGSLAPGQRAVAMIEDLVDGSAETVLTPREIPHTAVAYLEQGGYSVSSSAVTEQARAIKSVAEIERLRQVQRATAQGMARAEAILATADPGEKTVQWAGGPLTTARLRREVNAELTAAGVRDAGNSVIGSGPTAADLHYTGTAPIRGGETVLLDLSPRGPHGYYGDMTRTFVVDGDGGWERRAYIAVEAAREAALAEVEAGRSGLTVHQEAAAELAAHGFDPSASETEPGFTHGTGHGVGVSLHERPSLSADTELQAGHVVTVEPGVYDPAHGGVRLEDLIVVREDGYETLAAYPFGSTPTAR
ncbi:MAG: Xaa-pro aminopeptidase [uncultured archaeon A07HR60]|nr:MAG: Xaa-pro aminopeptidase [uncultured archaeon A07HR60]